MKAFLAALVPLTILLMAASLACVISYFTLMLIGDVFPLDKVINKVAKLLLVLSIFPAMSMFNLTRTDLGFVEKKRMIRHFFGGFGLGIITLLPVFIVLYLLGVNRVDVSKEWSAIWVFKKLLTSFLLALLISLAEEPIFRGALLAGLKRKMPVIYAVIISSVYYALLHFLDSHTRFSYEELTFFSGFILLGEALLNVFNVSNLSAFVALLSVGLFLGIVRARIPGSLVLCIGCHTAWVAQIKFNKALFNVDPDSEFIYLVSNYDGVIGPLVSGWMFFTIALYLLYARYTQKHKL